MSCTTKGHFKISTTLSGTQTEYVALAINISYESLASEDSGRVDSGEMKINWILRKIIKLEITMPPLKESELATKCPLSKVQGQEYWIEFYDFYSLTWKKINVYTSNSSASIYSGVKYDGVWQDISFSAIELKGE